MTTQPFLLSDRVVCGQQKTYNNAQVLSPRASQTDGERHSSCLTRCAGQQQPNMRGAQSASCDQCSAPHRQQQKQHTPADTSRYDDDHSGWCRCCGSLRWRGGGSSCPNGTVLVVHTHLHTSSDEAFLNGKALGCSSIAVLDVRSHHLSRAVRHFASLATTVLQL